MGTRDGHTCLADNPDKKAELQKSCPFLLIHLGERGLSSNMVVDMTRPGERRVKCPHEHCISTHAENDQLLDQDRIAIDGRGHWPVGMYRRG